jgi:hypothetical protein
MAAKRRRSRYVAEEIGLSGFGGYGTFVAVVRVRTDDGPAETSGRNSA